MSGSYLAAAALRPHLWAERPLEPGDSLRRWWRGEAPAGGAGTEAPRLLLLDRSMPGGHPDLARLAPLLSGEERARQAHFRQPPDRERFLLGRGCLRLVLGMLLGRDPQTLQLREGPKGKPALAATGPCAAGLAFNLAHSGDLILLAFHPARPVGVDVERLRPALAWRPIARRCFSAPELLSLEALPPAQRAEGFLRAWCRLEARLKSSGEGLAGLERLRREGPQPEPPLWDVGVPAGYGAAVALAPAP